MKNMFAQALLGAVALALATPAAAASWKIDINHSEMTFTARHLKWAKVKGHFNAWGGTAVIDEKDITRSSVEVTFDMKSIDTGNEDRDKDLQGEKFFDTAKFPTATFKSTKVEQLKDKAGFLKLTGDLTLKGVTKPVSFEVEMSPEFKDPGGRAHLAFQGGHLVINRQDFGLTFNAAAEGLKIASDEVELDINIELFAKDFDKKDAKDKK